VLISSYWIGMSWKAYHGGIRPRKQRGGNSRRWRIEDER
jgi:hypothetical protein